MSSYAEVLKAIADIEDKVLSKQREMADDILFLKQRGIAMPDDGLARKGRAPGAIIAEAIDAEFGALQKNRTLGLQVKAFAGTPIGSGDVSTGTSLPGIAAPVGVYHGILDVLPAKPQGSTSSLRYVRENISLQTGNTDVQAGEGAAKSWMQPGFEVINQSPITIAGLAKLTEQSVRNQTELIAAVEGILRRDIALQLDQKVLLGNATPAWTGLIPLATLDTSGLFGERVDAIMECSTTMEILGAMPTVVMMQAGDWLQTALDKDSVGSYKNGAYLRDIERRIGRARVGLSINVTAARALLIDPGFVEIYASQEVNVTMAYVNDDLEKNLISLRVEAEFIPVLRSTRGIRLSAPMP